MSADLDARPPRASVPSARASDPPIPISFIYKRGDVIAGRYRLKRVLGQGGVGMVWHAHDTTLDIDVALKLIRGEMLLEETVDRLHREARAAAKIDHPAIVRILDLGSSEIGEPFIVMELLEGEDLRTRLGDKGAMDPIEAVRTILPIAHALEIAHAHGVVHRDVKPENVFLGRSIAPLVQPKLLDFGIAKVDHANDVRLTRTGALLGSPSYMAPEQARGDEADQRADIWSLCVVLYEMISLRTPFEGLNKNAILHAIITKEATPLPDVVPDLDDLWTILSGGITKDPDKRLQEMGDLVDQLCAWLLSRGVMEDIAGNPVMPAPPAGVRDFHSTVPPPPMPMLSSRFADRTTIGLSEAPWRKRRLHLLAIGAFFLAAVAALWFGVFRERIQARALDTASPGLQPSPPERATGSQGPLVATQSAATAPQPAATAAPPAPTASTPRQARRSTATRTSRTAGRVSKQRVRPTSTATATATTFSVATTPSAPPRKLRDPFE